MTSAGHKLAWKLGQFHGMVDDFKQEAALAKLEGKDPDNAIRYAYRYWVFGRKGHHRSKIDIPKFADITKVKKLSTPSVEQEFARRELLQYLWGSGTPSVKAALQAIVLGKRHCWRQEIKKELQQLLITL